MTLNCSQINTLPQKGRILKFFGNLRKVFGEAVVVYSDNIKDICDELSANPKFKPNMKIYHEVQFDLNVAIFEQISKKIIRVFPPLILSKKGGGLFQVIIGVVLIVVGLVINWFTAGTAGTPLIMQGIGMVAAGLYQMMNTPPDTRETEKKEKGYSGLPKSTMAEGTRIGILLGTFLVGMHLMSYFSTTSQESK